MQLQDVLGSNFMCVQCALYIVHVQCPREPFWNHHLIFSMKENRQTSCNDDSLHWKISETVIEHRFSLFWSCYTICKTYIGQLNSLSFCSWIKLWETRILFSFCMTYTYHVRCSVFRYLLFSTYYALIINELELTEYYNTASLDSNRRAIDCCCWLN